MAIKTETKAVNGSICLVICLAMCSENQTLEI